MRWLRRMLWLLPLFPLLRLFRLFRMFSLRGLFPLRPLLLTGDHLKKLSLPKPLWLPPCTTQLSYRGFA